MDEKEEESKKEKKSTKHEVSCTTISCGGCLIIFGIFALLGFLTYKKPDIVVGRVVSYLNDGIKMRSIEEEKDSFEILASIYSQLNSSSKEQELTLTEDELTILARSAYSDLDNAEISIEDGSLFLYWTVSDNVGNKPLYGVVEIKRVNGQNKVEHFGLKRISFPKIVNEFITNKVDDAIDQGDENNSVDEFILKLINANNSFKIKDIIYSDKEAKLILIKK